MDKAKIEKISKALGDETRLLIFAAISSCDEMNCGQIVSLQGVTPATVSHHLKILSEAGLIETRREGQFIYNKTIPKAVEDYSQALTSLARRKRNKRESA
jgi:ArsR family transcriptional regulator, arsenate/arsenite/antimonite-responsive transcriptional repressor